MFIQEGGLDLSLASQSAWLEGAAQLPRLDLNAWAALLPSACSRSPTSSPVTQLGFRALLDLCGLDQVQETQGCCGSGSSLRTLQSLVLGSIASPAPERLCQKLSTRLAGNC